MARARRRAQQADGETNDVETESSRDPEPASTAERRRLRRAWAQRIRRIYASRQGETWFRLRLGGERRSPLRRSQPVDPLTCRCGAKMRILAFILDPQVVAKILRHIAARDTARERAPPSSALAS